MGSGPILFPNGRSAAPNGTPFLYNSSSFCIKNASAPANFLEIHIKKLAHWALGEHFYTKFLDLCIKMPLRRAMLELLYISFLQLCIEFVLLYAKNP
jgi:hypothetical protein